MNATEVKKGSSNMTPDKETHVSEEREPSSKCEAATDDSPPQIPQKSPRVQSMLGKDGTCSSPPLPPRTRPVESSSKFVESEPCTSLLSVNQHQPATALPDHQQVPVKVTTLKGLSETPEDLPAVIRFVNGYYGKTSRFSVSAGDCFQVNLLKRSRVINFQDVARREYTIPLSSTAKFGLLCEDAESDLNPSLKTISSIFAMKKLPHVIYALKDGEDMKRKVIVSEGDILVIKGSKKKALQCYNLRTGSDIWLQRHFQCTFTLDPEKTKVFPLEIANHLPNVFPCQAKLYVRGGDAHSPLDGKVVTLTGCSVDISLVATEAKPSPNKKRSWIHLPLDGNLSDLSIEIMPLENIQDLFDETHKLMEDYDPSVGQTFTDRGSDEAFDIQSSLFREVRPDQKNVDVELVTNKSISTAKQSQTRDELFKPDTRVASNGKAKYDVMGENTLATSSDIQVPQKSSNTTEILVPSHGTTRHSLSPALNTLLPQSRPADSQLWPQSDHVYATILELPLPIKPASRPPVKPRNKVASYSSPVTSPKFPKLPASADSESKSDDEHVSIPVTAPQPLTLDHPIAKPRNKPSKKHGYPCSVTNESPLASNTSAPSTPVTRSEIPPIDKSPYVSLLPHPATTDSTTDAQTPVPYSRHPRRKRADKPTHQQGNTAFLKEMDVSQVSYHLCNEPHLRSRAAV